MSQTSARSLFEAARADAPPASTRDAMWESVALATGTAAVAGGASQAGAGGAKAAFATTSGAKLLAIGGLIGAASTALGVVVALTAAPFGGAAENGAAPIAGGPRSQHVVARGARMSEAPARRLDPSTVGEGGAREGAGAGAGAGAGTTARVGTSPGFAAAPVDPLAEEARLLTEARAALVAGDALRALALVQGTRRLGTRAMEPEEMGLEARALRALGRADEAAATELLLRRRYPGHALAR